MRQYKCAFIVGASGGLGRAIALEIAPCCSELVIASRQVSKLEELKRDIESSYPGKTVRVVPFDLEKQDSIVSALHEVDFTRVDLLIMNAGYGTFKHFLDADWDSVESTIVGNLIGTMKLVHAALPLMVEGALSSGNRAELVVISSHSTGMRIPYFSVYVPVKTFLTQWARTIAMELKGRPITVTVPCPGAMLTSFADRSGIPRMVKVPEYPESVAKQCVKLFGRGGVHYLNNYDRFLQFINWLLPVFVMDWLVNSVQQRSLSRVSKN